MYHSSASSARSEKFCFHGSMLPLYVFVSFSANQPATASCSHFARPVDAREMKVEKRLSVPPRISARRRELSFTSVVGLNKYWKSITPRSERFSEDYVIAIGGGVGGNHAKKRNEKKVARKYPKSTSPLTVLNRSALFSSFSSQHHRKLLPLCPRRPTSTATKEDMKMWSLHFDRQ